MRSAETVMSSPAESVLYAHRYHEMRARAPRSEELLQKADEPADDPTA